jgi:arylsulfatase A-like enzyme
MRVTTQDTAGRAAADPPRALAAHAGGGLVAGAVLAIALVVLESALLGAWWRGLVIPPHGLARTEMFDFLTEIYGLLQPPLAAVLSPAMAGIYPPGAAGVGRLALDLARAALPTGLLLGLVIGMLCAAARRPPSVRAVVGLLALVGVVVEITLWLASVHVPVDGSVVRLARGAARDFVWDGVLVSLLALAPAAALAGRLAPRLVAHGGAARLAVPLVLVGVAFGLSGSAAGVAREPTPPPAEPAAVPAGGRPNVLLVSIDSLRADRLGCYGHTRPTSPRIDRLAAAGARFAAAWSTTSWTLPAHVSMLTGRSLLGHGVLGESRIPTQVPVLAELLGAAGYTTAAFVSAPYLSSRFGFARGFDLYDDFSVPFTPDRESRERAQATVSAPLLHPSVERWLRSTAREPFFLFLHYFDVHYDYSPPAPFDRMFDPDYAGPITGRNFHADRRIRAGMPARDLEHLLALYDGEIRFTDGYVGRVLDLLAELGHADDTIVVLTSDHGDEFFEHGDKGHHRTLYEEVLHVPLVVSFPGRLPAGRVVNEPVSIVDIVPTVLELAGLPTPAAVEGQSLVPLLRPEARPNAPARERALVAELYLKPNLNLQVALRRDRLKRIQSLNFPHSETYDLGDDPHEREPRRPDVTTAALGGDLARWLAGTWPSYGALQTEPRAVALDQGQIEALRALGYVE